MCKLCLTHRKFVCKVSWVRRARYEDESYFVPKLSTIPLVCNAVREGDIREIIYQANQLKMAKTEYTDWANYIIRLAENFQIEKIQDIFNYELS